MLRGIRTILEPFKFPIAHNVLCANTPNLEARVFSTTGYLLVKQTQNEGTVTSEEGVKSKSTLSKAMKAYLQRAQEHDEFMKIQRHEYEVGKRHLANMMGEDPETFTQEDVDNAIEYLFPSGLFEKKARPLMKPPEEVFPQRKAAEFDETGRPHHFLFYTGKPNFYQVLHDAVQNINELTTFEDNMIRKNLQPDPNLALNTSGSNWLEKKFLELKLVEFLTDKEYSSFVNVMDKLISMPYSYRAKEFIMQYRKSLMSHSKTYEAIKPQIGEDGKQFVTVYECRRKSAIATVTITMPGTGQIRINGEDINYFKDTQSKEQNYGLTMKIML